MVMVMVAVADRNWGKVPSGPIRESGLFVLLAFDSSNSIV